MNYFSFLPLINKPTRRAEFSATLIDNTFCNDLHGSKLVNGILFTDIPDHFPHFCINTNSSLATPPQYMRMRQYTQKNISEFQNEIKHIDWSNILHSNCCQSAFSLLHKTFLKSFDHCFPFKLMKTNYNNRKIWLTPALKNP